MFTQKKEISVTITDGIPSERHNHDLSFRSTLEHVTPRPDGIVELIPYSADCSYSQQFNQHLVPHIDEYNERRNQDLAIAREQYEAGLRKSRPNVSHYKYINYDYYGDHKNDLVTNPRTRERHTITFFRSFIITLGDAQDRAKGTISEAQAVSIFKDEVEMFSKCFPYFTIVGATAHLDEHALHMHLDYFICYPIPNPRRGLNVGFGRDKALTLMGYTPEFSIMNEQGKGRPILFNAMRNRLYFSLETILSKHGFRMIYNVTRRKQPGKDASTNMPLDEWQYQRDLTKNMQHTKNMALDILESDEVSPDSLKAALGAVIAAESACHSMESLPKNKFTGDYKISEPLYQHLIIALSDLQATFAHLVQQAERAEQYARELAELKEQLVQADLQLQEMEILRSSLFDLQIQAAAAQSREQKLKAQNDSMKQFMKNTYAASGQTLYDRFISLNKPRQISK